MQRDCIVANRLYMRHNNRQMDQAASARCICNTIALNRCTELHTRQMDQAASARCICNTIASNRCAELHTVTSKKSIVAYATEWSDAPHMNLVAGRPKSPIVAVVMSGMGGGILCKLLERGGVQGLPHCRSCRRRKIGSSCRRNGAGAVG